MGFKVTYSCYGGEFSLSHSSDEDTKAAMQSGTYATVHKWLMAEAVAFIDSGVLDVKDFDEEAEMIAIAEIEDDVEDEQ